MRSSSYVSLRKKWHKNVSKKFYPFDYFTWNNYKFRLNYDATLEWDDGQQFGVGLMNCDSDYQLKITPSYKVEFGFENKVYIYEKKGSYNYGLASFSPGNRDEPLRVLADYLNKIFAFCEEHRINLTDTMYIYAFDLTGEFKSDLYQDKLYPNREDQFFAEFGRGKTLEEYNQSNDILSFLITDYIAHTVITFRKSYIRALHHYNQEPYGDNADVKRILWCGPRLIDTELKHVIYDRVLKFTNLTLIPNLETAQRTLDCPTESGRRPWEMKALIKLYDLLLSQCLHHIGES